MTTKKPRQGTLERLEQLAAGAKAQSARAEQAAYRDRHTSRGAASEVRHVDVDAYLAEQKAKGKR